MLDSESLEYFLNLDAEGQEKLMEKAMGYCLKRDLAREETPTFFYAKSEFMKAIHRFLVVERAKNRFKEWSKETGIVDHVKALEAEYEKNCSTPKE